MADLKKLFVLVPSTTTGFDGAAVSRADGNNKIYFDQAKNTIWHKGIKYGMDPSTADELKDVIALVGEKPEYWDEFDTVIDKVCDASTRLDTAETRLASFDASAATWDDALQTVTAAGDDYLDASFGDKTDNTQALTIGIKTDMIKGTTTEVYANRKALTTQGYVDEEVAKAVKGGVQYKGTTSSLPDKTTAVNGDMYKVVYAEGSEKITIDDKEAKNGDVIIYHLDGESETGNWQLIPAGDDVEYTGIKVGTTTVIDATVGGDVDFVAETGDSALITVTGASGSVTYSATDKLKTAIANAEADHTEITREETGILARLTSAEARLTNAETDIETLDASTQNHCNDLDSAIERIDTSIGDLPNGKTIVEYIDEQIEDADADLEDLSTYVRGTVDASILDLSTKINNMDVAEHYVGDGNVQVEYSEENGIVTISDVSVAEAVVSFVEATTDSSADLVVAEGDETKLLNAGAVAEIKDYVDAVAAANQEAITAKVSKDGAAAAKDTNIIEVSSTDDHEIIVKTSTLGNVGLVHNAETGKWIPGEAEENKTGLALAADVAVELANDEQVIAAAFNDHEDRIKAMEDWDFWETYEVQ